MTATAEPRQVKKSTFREPRTTIPAPSPLTLTAHAPGIVTAKIGSLPVTAAVFDQLDPAVDMDHRMARVNLLGQHRVTIGLLDDKVVRSGYCHAEHQTLPLLILSESK